MTWLLQHWQTITALTIVGVTIAVFILRALRSKKSSCGHNCGCGIKK